MLQRKGPASQPRWWRDTRYEKGRTVWQVRGRRTFQTGLLAHNGREPLLTATSAMAGFTVSNIGKPRERKPASVW